MPIIAASQQRRARRTEVLVAGGGVAALELLLALRVHAGARVAITILTPGDEFIYRPMTVAVPFRRGGPRLDHWSQIAAHQGATLVLDTLDAVDVDARTVSTRGGHRLSFDVLALTTGARPVEPLAGALTFRGGTADTHALRRIVAEICGGDAASVAFALPATTIWPLPLYELALLTAHELRERGARARVALITPEERPLALFGAAAEEALAPLIDALGVDLHVCRRPREVVEGGLALDGGEVVAADRVITLADAAGRPVAGLPADRRGFLPVDLHGRVSGLRGIYAAGEATAFPLRQGGLATQQADAVADAIATVCGAAVRPAPFRPVLRGLLLTSGAPLYLHARPGAPGESIASTRALWSPADKIAGRYLTPYLSTARPARVAATPLVERVPATARSPLGHDAAELALAFADAEAGWRDFERALQALEAAEALDPDALTDAHERKRAGWLAQIDPAAASSGPGAGG